MIYDTLVCISVHIIKLSCLPTCGHCYKHVTCITLSTYWPATTCFQTIILLQTRYMYHNFHILACHHLLPNHNHHYGHHSNTDDNLMDNIPISPDALTSSATLHIVYFNLIPTTLNYEVAAHTHPKPLPLIVHSVVSDHPSIDATC